MRRFPVLLAPVAAAVLLLAGPAVATEAPAGGGGTEGAGAAEQPAVEPEATEGHGAGDEVEGGEQGKRPLPIDLTDPQDIVGAVLLGLSAMAVAAGAVNLIKQLRGERPQADGTWRAR